MTDKIRILLELGDPGHQAAWPDYLQYGFDEGDVPALVNMVSDPSLHQAGVDSLEVWAPLHAWRALGQIGSKDAIDPLIHLFETIHDDDWALSELPRVLGMIGEAAIAPLAAYLNTPWHEEFARVMAADGLAEIAKRHPSSRTRVIRCYQDYMAMPDESADMLNGLLIGYLIDLDAAEAIDDIRRLFGKSCVDITCAGDLEEVEIALGLRTTRSTPRPDFAKLFARDHSKEIPKPPDNASILELLEYYLMRYGHDDAILGVSELDGFCAALACAPDTIIPSRWFPAIWGGPDLEPEWRGEAEFTEFSQAAFTFYNQVMHFFDEGNFEAIFLERKAEGKTYTIVDEWCEGFLRGLSLWGPLSTADTAMTEECIRPLKLFATDSGIEKLDAMNEDEITALQQAIEPGVRRLHQYFLTRRRSPAQPFMHDTPKTGRNDPCPCGSGKKYKKCCLH